MKKLYLWYLSKFNDLFVSADEDGENSTKDDVKLSSVLANVLLVGALAGVFLVLVDIRGFYVDPQHGYGTFGDFLGGVLNPFLTFLTLFGLIATIVIQRQELRLARKEYSNTSSALNTQAVETTFFNLLDLHNNIVDSLVINEGAFPRINNLMRDLRQNLQNQMTIAERRSLPLPKDIRGRDVFELLANEMSNEKDPKKVYAYYFDFNRSHNHLLGHYFRNLYQILKFIDREGDYEVNKKYARILRAQLSFYELAILFVNCLDKISDRGEFRDLLVKYQMLEHLTIYNDKPPVFKLVHKVPVSLEYVLWYAGERNASGHNLGGAFGENINLWANLRDVELD